MGRSATPTCGCIVHVSLALCAVTDARYDAPDESAMVGGGSCGVWRVLLAEQPERRCGTGWRSGRSCRCSDARRRELRRPVQPSAGGSARSRLHDDVEPRHPRRHGDRTPARCRRPARAHDRMRERSRARAATRRRRSRARSTGARARTRSSRSPRARTRCPRRSPCRAASSCAAPAPTPPRHVIVSTNGGPVLADRHDAGHRLLRGSGFDAAAKPLLTQDATKETTTVTVASASGFAAGDLALDRSARRRAR